MESFKEKEGTWTMGAILLSRKSTQASKQSPVMSEKGGGAGAMDGEDGDGDGQGMERRSLINAPTTGSLGLAFWVETIISFIFHFSLLFL
jgi:hypothetical protein